MVLPKGERPRIKVVDKDGKPQPAVRLDLVRDVPAATGGKPQRKFGPASAISRWEILRTDIDGYLHFKEPLAAGTWDIRVKGRQLLREVPKLSPRSSTVPAMCYGQIARLPSVYTVQGRLAGWSGKTC